MAGLAITAAPVVCYPSRVLLSRSSATPINTILPHLCGPIGLHMIPESLDPVPTDIFLRIPRGEYRGQTVWLLAILRDIRSLRAALPSVRG